MNDLGLRETVDRYNKYIWNADIWDEFREIFPPHLAEHMIRKFEDICELYGRDAAPAILWSQIDENCQARIMERAINFE